MFTVIVTEKGGSKQTLEFDEEMVTIGRVQGNQIILPRGNVSKKHAKLEFKGGEFRMTDLNSTNGTYINGRRITGSMIVKPGDKVYVGEFILGLEAGVESPPLAPPAASPLAPPAAASPKVPRPKGPRPPVVKPARPAAPAPAPERSPAPTPVIDSDEDDEEFSSLDMHEVPRVPRTGAPKPKAKKPPAPTVATSTIPEGAESDLIGNLVDAVSRQIKRVERQKVPVTLDEGNAGKVRLILTDLVGELVSRGKVPPTRESGQLLENAARAIVDLGPLTAWLGDPSVMEIRITGPDSIFLRRTAGWEEAPTGFVGEEDLGEKLRCLGAGVTGRDEGAVAGMVRYRLEDGTLVLAALSPVATSGPSAHIFKNVSAQLKHGARLNMMPEGKVRDIIEKGIFDKARFAVIGSTLPYRISILTDMIRLIPAGTLVVGLEDVPFIGFRGKHFVGLAAHGTRKGDERSAGVGSLIPRAIDLGPEWIVASGGWWGDVGEIMACAAMGMGFMADLPLAGREPVRELLTGLATTKVGVSAEQAGYFLAESFDFLVTAGCDEEGRPVIDRVVGTGSMGSEWMPTVMYER